MTARMSETIELVVSYEALARIDAAREGLHETREEFILRAALSEAKHVRDSAKAAQKHAARNRGV